MGLDCLVLNRFQYVALLDSSFYLLWWFCAFPIFVLQKWDFSFLFWKVFFVLGLCFACKIKNLIFLLAEFKRVFIAWCYIVLFCTCSSFLLLVVLLICIFELFWVEISFFIWVFCSICYMSSSGFHLFRDLSLLSLGFGSLFQCFSVHWIS